MVTLYLYEEGGQLVPEWAAYASHDFHGDDLRRRWDDATDLKIENGTRCVCRGRVALVLFRRGEIPGGGEPAFCRAGWRDWCRAGTSSGPKRSASLRGTLCMCVRGLRPRRRPAHRPGRPANLVAGGWNESTPWVSQYRGLWGLFARDPISGENAPAGPMYNRRFAARLVV